MLHVGVKLLHFGFKGAAARLELRHGVKALELRHGEAALREEHDVVYIGPAVAGVATQTMCKQTRRNKTETRQKNGLPFSLQCRLRCGSFGSALRVRLLLSVLTSARAVCAQGARCPLSCDSRPAFAWGNTKPKKKSRRNKSFLFSQLRLDPHKHDVYFARIGIAQNFGLRGYLSICQGRSVLYTAHGSIYRPLSQTSRPHQDWRWKGLHPLVRSGSHTLSPRNLHRWKAPRVPVGGTCSMPWGRQARHQMGQMVLGFRLTARRSGATCPNHRHRSPTSSGALAKLVHFRGGRHLQAANLTCGSFPASIHRSCTLLWTPRRKRSHGRHVFGRRTSRLTRGWSLGRVSSSWRRRRPQVPEA